MFTYSMCTGNNVALDTAGFDTLLQLLGEIICE